MHHNKFTDIFSETFLIELTLEKAVEAGLSRDAFRAVNIQIEKLRRMMKGRRPALTAGVATKTERKRIGRESAAITEQLKVVRDVSWRAFTELQRQVYPSTTKREIGEGRKGYERLRALAVKDISRRVKRRAVERYLSGQGRWSGLPENFQ